MRKLIAVLSALLLVGLSFTATAQDLYTRLLAEYLRGETVGESMTAVNTDGALLVRFVAHGESLRIAACGLAVSLPSRKRFGILNAVTPFS